ncbi:MAG: hypothetical protein GYA33_13730, partial [Thermogutta sp.]|nr:hypothetical protein [Thermogutta sp.]
EQPRDAAAAVAEPPPTDSPHPEVEIALWPRVKAFRGRADCRVLLIAEAGLPHPRLLRQADMVLGPWESPPAGLILGRGAGYFPVAQLEAALAGIQ